MATWNEIVEAQRARTEAAQQKAKIAEDAMEGGALLIKEMLTEAGLSFTTEHRGFGMTGRGEYVQPFLIVMARPPNATDADVMDKELCFQLKYGQRATGHSYYDKAETIHGRLMSLRTARLLLAGQEVKLYGDDKTLQELMTDRGVGRAPTWERELMKLAAEMVTKGSL